jgi:D-inositol-3-phosphate glycosyltransferase
MNVYLLQVAREFGRRGHLVDVFTRRHDPADPQIVELGSNARVVHIKAGGYDETKEALYEVIPEFISNLHDFQRAEDLSYGLVHSHYWLSGRVGMVLARQWGVPHVATFHTLAKLKLQARAGEKESPLRVPTERLIMGAADAMLVSTEPEKRDIARLYGVSPAKITVVPPGVDLELFRPMDKSRARKELGILESRVVLYVGRLEALKGIGVLIQATAQLEGREDTRVMVVGGNRKGDRLAVKLKAEAEALGIGQKVTFTGPVPQSELPRYYNAADVFVLPSHYESFGLAALEAMACGVPVVVSRVGGLTTFISDGKEGYLIPWRCPDPFAQRIEVLLSNPALRTAMGRAATAKAEGMGWDVVADRMLCFYDSLLTKAWESAAGA